MIGEEGEGLDHAAALRLECHVLLIHPRVHGGVTRPARGLVHEDRLGIALVGIESEPVQRAGDAAALAVGEMTFGDIVQIEIDHPRMIRRQQDARPVPVEQGLLGGAGGGGSSGGLREVLREAGLLGKIAASVAAAGEAHRESQQQRHDTLGHDVS